jgi:electron transfer flavoprotein alpha subunit
VILGVVEHDRGKLNPLSLQMLTLARRLSSQLSLPLHAVLVGAEARPLVGEVASHGASTIHLAESDELGDYAPGAWARCIRQVTDSSGPVAVMAAGSERGNEVMAHLAARMELPLAANCTEVRPPEVGAGDYEVTRLRWGGSLLEDARLSASVKLLTIAPHAVAAEASVSFGEPAVEVFTPQLAASDLRVRVVERVAPEPGRTSLADAAVVVGGGRGVGSADGFRVLEELAALLSGTVGCSRAVTSLGWRPHSDQVGQTGTRIAPDVYIACGISGAIQHMVGCKSAKCIVAINKDPDAPITAQADFVIVGDVQQVLPALVDALRSAQTRP